MLSIRNLNKTYQDGRKKRVIFNGLNWEIAEGSFTGLLGTSGLGKSTLINIIGGIESYQSGEVVVHGVNYSDSNAKQRLVLRKKDIGFIFQSIYLLPHLTVEENILLPLEINNIPPDTFEINKLLTRFGIANSQDKFPDSLSGGEQQRAALIRAIIHRPRLVLADEPTGNLDRENGLMMIETLKVLSQEYKITVIMVTHDSSFLPLF